MSKETRKKLMEELDERGIKYNRLSRESTLQKLLDESEETKNRETTKEKLHVLTQKDLDNNQGLVEAGLKVGDEISFDSVMEAPEEEVKKTKTKAQLKKEAETNEHRRKVREAHYAPSVVVINGKRYEQTRHEDGTTDLKLIA